MPVYYPSCVVNVQLRYDEMIQIVNLPQPVAQDGEIDLTDVSKSGLKGIKSAEELKKESQQPSDSIDFTSATERLVKRTGEQDNSSLFVNIVPKTASVQFNGYRQAGTFSVMVQWKELPIDPRLVRAGLVQIFQGTVDPSDFASGMIRTRRDGSRESILNIFKNVGSTEIDPDKLVMVGLMDSWKVTHDSNGSWVHFEGRDLRGILLDSPVNPIILGRLDYTKPLDQVVKQLIETHPMSKAKYFKYENMVNAEEWPKKKIPVPADNEIRPRRSASGQKTSLGVQSGSSNYWDIITNLCFRVGAIPYLENQSLRIRPARSIFDQQKPSDDSWSPFMDRNGVRGPRVDSEGRPFYVRRMVHGRNIESLNFERKYTGVKVPVIECISTDHSNNERGKQKLLKVQIPSRKELAKLVGSVSPDGLVSQTERVRVPVAGVRNKAQLEEIAKNLYEEIGQGELGGNIKTKNLSSFGGNQRGLPDDDNADPDLLTMRPGDAIEILVDISKVGSKAPIVSEFTDYNRRDFDEQVKAVLAAMKGKIGGIDENTARVLVASARSNIVDVLQFFRVYNINFNWSDGIPDIAFDFHNYYIARYKGATEELGNAQAKPKPGDNETRRQKKKKDRAGRARGNRNRGTN